MRKTKCKSCNGGWIPGVLENSKCPHCTNGEISVYTIQELREGKVLCVNDLTVDDLIKVMLHSFTSDAKPAGDNKYYGGMDVIWYAIDNNHNYLPTQSVKIFLEEIEQEEKKRIQEKFKIIMDEANELVKQCPNCKEEDCACVEEPEFKWGEEVEWSAYEGAGYVPGTYLCRNPDMPEEHLIFNEARLLHSVKIIRKPQKITLTLSQIAEKFNCKPEQIKII